MSEPFVQGEEGVIFTNTLFNCLATVDDDHSFRPLWRPPWISRLASEDRCHLNGLAVREGRPRYATAMSRSDVHDGWRDRRRAGVGSRTAPAPESVDFP